MNFWNNLIRWFNKTSDLPPTFGVFHIIWLIIIVACCTLLIVFRKRIIKDKKIKIILLSIWIFLVVLEILKLISYSTIIDSKTGEISYKFDWGVFPFQFCSTPLYLLPFIIFLKEGTIKKRIELFSSIFFLVAGLAGTIIPSFSYIIWINFQTLFYHGSMIFIAILLAYKNRNEFKLINYLQSNIIFIGLVALALFFNWFIPTVAPEALKYNFNMFFISWRYAPKMPVLGDVWKAVPYPVYLLLYIIGFVVLCSIIYIVYSLLLNHKVDFKLKTNVTSKKNNN